MDKVGKPKSRPQKMSPKPQRFLTKWIHRLGNVFSPFDDEKEKKALHGKEIPINVSRNHKQGGERKRPRVGKKALPARDTPTTIVLPPTEDLWRDSRVPTHKEKERHQQERGQWIHSHSAGPFSSPPESLILRGISSSLSSGHAEKKGNLRELGLHGSGEESVRRGLFKLRTEILWKMDEQFEAMISRMTAMESRMETLETTLHTVLDASSRGRSDFSELPLAPSRIDASQWIDSSEKEKKHTWEKSEEAFVWEIVSREYASVMDSHAHTMAPKKSTIPDMHNAEDAAADPRCIAGGVHDGERRQDHIESESNVSEEVDDDLESPLTLHPDPGFEEFHVGDDPDE